MPIVNVPEVTRLPYNDPKFEGQIGPTTDRSTSDFPQPVAAPDGAPNIVIIMTDDVGFGAGSTFGGPINTPSMDQLAEEGIKYNRFHTTSLCSPTRAALLSGRNPHNAATGIIMERALGYPGYNTMMPKSCGTIAETLSLNGYSTAWFGKNHNVPDWETSKIGPFDHWPTGMGFEKFYGFIGGDTNQWNPNVYDGTVPIFPDRDNPDYHLDTDLADQAVNWIKEKKALDPEKPYFLYYVPGATHAPHHVPKEWIRKYKGMFDQGWDEQRKQTWLKQKKMGIIPYTAELTKRPDNIGAWDDLNDEHKKVFSHMMEIYAGFLEFSDYNIGRVLQAIEDTHQKKNTLVIYIQGDNGGSAEGTEQGTTNELAHLGNKLPEPWDYILDHMEELGGPKHYNHFPVAWAWAMNSPMQWTKRFASHFGGTRNGMVMRWPKQIDRSMNGKIANQFHHVIDVSATVLEASGVKWPVDVINGIKQKEIDGMPMNYTWDPANVDVEKREVQVFEMWGNRGIYHKDWLACTTPQTFPWGSTGIGGDTDDTITLDSFDWELYNLKYDFTQGNDLMRPDGDKEVKPKHKKKLNELKALWWQQAVKNHILPLNFSEATNIDAILERPSMVRGRKKFIYDDAVVGIPEGCAPELRNTSYTITALIEIPELRGFGKELPELAGNGVIITQGGRFGGWGIVILDNKPTWSYKCSQIPEQQIRIDWDSELGPGSHKIQVHFDYDYDNPDLPMGAGGDWYLSVDDATPIKESLGFSVGGRFSVTETLDVGCDTGTPILEDFADRMPFKYNGKIKHVIIDIEDEDMTKAGRLASEKAKRDFDLATD